MGFVESIFCLLLATVGVTLLIYLLRTLFRPLFSLTRGSTGGLHLRKATAAVKRADELMEADKYEKALQELEKALVFTTGNSRQAIHATKEHNQNILSRCLIVAENLGGQIDNLPDVERLLLERAEIQLLLIKVNESFQSIAVRREQRGKELPSWGKADFRRRTSEVKNELQSNKKKLEDELKKFFESIRTPAPQDITYH